MFYEIINPSDKCFFEAPDLKTAFIVTTLLGGGQYAAKPESEDADEVPLFLFGGAQEWWDERFPGEDVSMSAKDNAGTVIPALRSVCYGDLRERKLYDSALKAIDDPEKRDAFIEEWNDRHRSSLNNIMGRAHAVANSLEKQFVQAN